MNRYWYLKWIALGVALAAGVSRIASAAALDPWGTWVADQPYVSKQIPPGALIMRGIGTDAYYVVEVNASTGAIPVDVGGGSITVNFSGPTDDPVPDYAAYIGGVDNSGDLQGVRVDVNGELQVDVLSSALPAGAATSAKQDTEIASLATIATNTGTTATNTGTIATNTGTTATNTGTIATNTGTTATNTGRIPAQGQALMAASMPVVIASNQSAIPVSTSSFPTTVTLNAGAADASTLRTSPASRVYSDSVRNDYSSVIVTTGAWVQMIASTAAAMNSVCITDQGGQVMELGTGAGGAETRVFLIAKGWSGCIPLRIAASTRIAIKAVSATANTGDFVLSGMN